MKDIDYDAIQTNFENLLKPLLTDTFLITLTEAVKVCGHNVDHVASAEFVKWCYDLVDQKAPNLNPYVSP
jgi:hypothetical protein